MKPSWRALIHLVLAALASSALSVPPPALAGGDKPVVVFPVGSNPYGKSYQEWSDTWWQWAYSIPADVNPLFDETGVNAAQGQSGPVWFLCGVLNVSGSAERSITVPKGKALLFPILNAEWDNLCPPLDPQPAPEDLVNVLQTDLAGFLDTVDALECDLDGTQIPGLLGYRVGPGGPFSVTFPEGNVFQAFGCSNVTAGTYFPFVSGGYYLMLSPLPSGDHTLHFSGHSTLGFGLEITYHIQVATPPTPGMSLQAAVAPNPFNPQAKLRYTTTKPGAVTVELFDLGGRLVRKLYETPFLPAGRHELVIDGRGWAGGQMPSGIYYYRVQAAEGSIVGRFAIVR